MQVKDLMKHDPELISPESTLQEAAEKMDSIKAGILPVGSKEQLVGMITDRDITVRATAKGKDPKTTRVSEIMTKEVYACYAEDNLSDAGNKMLAKDVGRLLVLDKASEKLVGIISLADIIENQGGESMIRGANARANAFQPA